MFRILFVSRTESQNNTAYSHRLRMLQTGLKKLGAYTDFLYLGNRRITSHTMIPFYLPMLVRIFRQYDFIHAGGTPSAVVANLCKPFHGKKVIYDNHGDHISEIIQNIKTKSLKKITRYALFIKGFIQEVIATWFSDEYLAVSKPLKRLMVNRGIKESRIHIIRNGVNLKLFSKGRAKPHRNFIVTYAGLFQSYQAIDDFIEAAQIIKRKNIRFQIIGFTSEDDRIKQIIKSRLGNQIDLIDNVSQDVLAQLLKESDALVIPRKQSKVTTIAFPTKFAEYIALGKPVIVSDVDETADFVNQYQCGLIYHPSAGELAKTIVELSQFSQNKLDQMGQNGRSLAEKIFNWDSICKTYFNILKRKTNPLENANLISRYKTALQIPQDISVTIEMIYQHFNLETNLAKKLLLSDKKERWKVATHCYSTFYKKLPWLRKEAGRKNREIIEKKNNDLMHIIGTSAKKIYEIGSGKGEFLFFLTAKGYQCSGCDLSPAWQISMKKHTNPSFGISDGIHLDQFEPNNNYDIVVSDNVMEHLHPDDVQEHFKGVYKILKKRGRYIIKTPHKFFGPTGIEKIFRMKTYVGFHLKEYTFKEIANFAKITNYRNSKAVFMLPSTLQKILKHPKSKKPQVNTFYLHYLCILETFLSVFKPELLRKIISQILRYFFLPRQVFMVIEK